MKVTLLIQRLNKLCAPASPRRAGLRSRGGRGCGPSGGLPLSEGGDGQQVQPDEAMERDGDRRNSPNGVMNQAVKGLSDDEIQALADHLAGL